MFKNILKLATCTLLATVISLTAANASEIKDNTELKHSVLLYGAKFTPDSLQDIISNDHSMDSSYLVALAWNREFARNFSHLGWETEVQMVKHFGGQHNMEFNALIAMRWHRFPWDRYVKTSFAVGEGLSLATRKPKLEQENRSKSSALLNYLMFDLTLAPPASRWYWSLRIHHRSGIFGLFDGVGGASNFIGSGIGFRF